MLAGFSPFNTQQMNEINDALKFIWQVDYSKQIYW